MSKYRQDEHILWHVMEVSSIPAQQKTKANSQSPHLAANSPEFFSHIPNVSSVVADTCVRHYGLPRNTTYSYRDSPFLGNLRRFPFSSTRYVLSSCAVRFARTESR